MATWFFIVDSAQLWVMGLYAFEESTFELQHCVSDKML